MKGTLRIVFVMIVCASVGSVASPGQKQPDSSGLGEQQLKDLVRKYVGTKVVVDSGASKPTYLLGDFNGDGNGDIAIIVMIADGPDDLKQNGVRCIDVDPYSSTNGRSIDPAKGSEMFQHCLGVVFLHGTSKSWNENSISEKYIVYNCFSSFRQIPKGQLIRRGRGSTGPTPKPIGDSILMELETGGTALVYWNGKTYRGFGVGIGD